MRIAFVLVVSALASACDNCGAPAPLTPVEDAGVSLPVVDAGFPQSDAGQEPSDAGVLDAGLPDAGFPDAGNPKESLFRIPSGSGEATSPRFKARVRVGSPPPGAERTP